MGTIQRFEDIEVWKLARMLSNKIYIVTTYGTFAKDYKLRDQINGSSGSVMDNIAEGFERDGRREFIQFLSIAKGSCGEVRSQLYRASDRAHITNDQLEELRSLAEETGKRISSFISYLKNTEYKGRKFEEPQTLYITEPD